MSNKTLEYRKADSWAYSLVRIGDAVFWRRRSIFHAITEDYVLSRWESVDDFHEHFEKGRIEQEPTP